MKKSVSCAQEADTASIVTNLTTISLFIHGSDCVFCPVFAVSFFLQLLHKTISTLMIGRSLRNFYDNDAYAALAWPCLADFFCSTNIGLTLVKDRNFARMFGTSAPRGVPLSTFNMFAAKFWQLLVMRL